MKTSKSPNDVAYVAYSTAKRSLPPYLHLKSPKKFTQHQLVACLVLKEFFTTDYRGIEEIINDSSDLKKILELECSPNYTTLCKAAKRLTKKDLLDKLIKEMVRPPKLRQQIIDFKKLPSDNLLHTLPEECTPAKSEVVWYCST